MKKEEELLKKKANLLGIDEAGRGCVMGDLCMACVEIGDIKSYEELKEWGCFDSKTFGSGAEAREKRSVLAEKIKQNFEYSVEIISSEIVDEYVYQKSLNILEVEYASKLLGRFHFDFAFLDGHNLFKSLENQKVFAENKADSKYLCVSAASVIAKDIRDTELIKLYKHLGLPADIPGGGYANKATLILILDYFKKYGKYPPGFRKSYRWKNLIEAIENLDSIN